MLFDKRSFRALCIAFVALLGLFIQVSAEVVIDTPSGETMTLKVPRQELDFDVKLPVLADGTPIKTFNWALDDCDLKIDVYRVQGRNSITTEVSAETLPSGAIVYDLTKISVTDEELTFEGFDAGNKATSVPIPNCTPVFTPTDDGKYKINVKLEGEFQKGFVLTAKEAEVFKEKSGENKASDAKLGLWAILGIVGGALVFALLAIGIIIGIFCYRRTKKRKAADLVAGLAKDNQDLEQQTAPFVPFESVSNLLKTDSTANQPKTESANLNESKQAASKNRKPSTESKQAAPSNKAIDKMMKVASNELNNVFGDGLKKPANEKAGYEEKNNMAKRSSMKDETRRKLEQATEDKKMLEDILDHEKAREEREEVQKHDRSDDTEDRLEKEGPDAKSCYRFIEKAKFEFATEFVPMGLVEKVADDYRAKEAERKAERRLERDKRFANRKANNGMLVDAALLAKKKELAAKQKKDSIDALEFMLVDLLKMMKDLEKG